jgi:hypothetical protein
MELPLDPPPQAASTAPARLIANNEVLFETMMASPLF